MRIIPLAELPETNLSVPLIRNQGRKKARHYQHTIGDLYSRCSEIVKNTQSEIERCRARAEKEGFTSGLSILFEECLSFVQKYEEIQHEKNRLCREALSEELKRTLNDPVIVERLVTLLQENSVPLDDPVIYLPDYITLPDSCSHLVRKTSASNDITLQSGRHAVRFPLAKYLEGSLTSAESAARSQDASLTALAAETRTALINHRQALLPEPAEEPAGYEDENEYRYEDEKEEMIA